jgi:asparagine synthase (glutamine-hydrolysing)
MLDKSSTRTDWIDVERLGATLSNPFQQEKKRDTALQQLSYAQIIATNLPMLLHWEDRDSMAHSVESRTPFLDYRLVEFLDGLPADYKLAKRQTKRVLRAGMQGVLPEKVCQRTDKMAFVTPEAVWACEQHPQRFRAALKQMIEASQGIVKPRALEIFEEMVKGTRPYSSMVWRVISFGEWMQRFSVVVT